jgi:uncharacterized LabA/DUF88 family protein
MNKTEITYAFIDSQNLNLGLSNDIYKNGKLVYKGWKLDYKKFFIFLKDKWRVSKAILFIGYIKENEDLYKKLKQFGYEIVFKPTVTDKNGKTKGNVDAELVLYSAAKLVDKYNKAIIVSGDGDFHCLYKYLQEKNKLKLIIIPNTKSASSLLKEFETYKFKVEFENKKLEYRQKK